MRSTTSAGTKAALLLLGSGFCALVYQTAWLRTFRLVFGASTLASAAVLAIFMAGLGFGGLWFGPRADRHRSPMGLYASLEAGIALSAALSPLLVTAVQALYIGLGGSERLGATGGTIVRLLLSTLVLGVPTFLMGGTLPAMARAVERAGDEGRRVVGRLYGVNTLGAVLGVLVTTFYSLEHLGVRKSLWLAALLNLLVVIAARSVARSLARDAEGSAEGSAPEPVPVPVPEEIPAASAAALTGEPPRWLVPVAAGVVGFAFLLMELVWYRLLGPLLGGSSYTFGLVLAVALLGIGVGGALYGAGEAGRSRPTLLSFAGTCTLEALCMVIPFALGDRLALLAAFVRPLASVGFFPLVGGWALVTCVVVFLPAVVAGYQFPLLIALLGRGRERVGREVGVAYAANTLGAIVGSIAGGFGLLPLLTAPGVWRLVVAILLLQAAVALAAGFRLGESRKAGSRASWGPLLSGALALLLLFAEGPTAFFRHTPIGAGRFRLDFSGPNEVRGRIESMRGRIVWEADGVESAVALDLTQEYSFIVNGKADGSALSDGPTQVLSGLLGALLHGQPKRVLVIGLGTGSTAGWLAQVPGVERVDVVELEPAILHVARVLSPINRDVLTNPKVHLVIGDGRELLLTSRERYDLVFSEPSNPYRAGVASLFSADFYRAVRQRLRPGALFLQWLQGYELDAQVVRTAQATLNSVFPAVESWQIGTADLLLVSTAEPLVHDFDRIAAQIRSEPFHSAFDSFWGMSDLAGFYSGFLAAPPLAAALRQGEGNEINTDDRSILEFAFAKNLGQVGLFDVSDLRSLALRRGEGRPLLTRGTPPDWARVEEMRAARSAFWGVALSDPLRLPEPAARSRVAARLAFARQDARAACRLWFEQPEPPQAFADRLLVAGCLADLGDPRAPEYLALLAAEHPIEARLGAARWHWAGGRAREAADELLPAFAAYRRTPFVYLPWAGRGVSLAPELAERDPDLVLPLYEALGTPFVADLFDHPRLLARFDVSRQLPDARLCVAALEPYERHPIWGERFLEYRYQCYRDRHHPLEERARRDWQAFRDLAPPRLGDGLPP